MCSDYLGIICLCYIYNMVKEHRLGKYCNIVKYQVSQNSIGIEDRLVSRAWKNILVLSLEKDLNKHCVGSHEFTTIIKSQLGRNTSVKYQHFVEK